MPTPSVSIGQLLAVSCPSPRACVAVGLIGPPVGATVALTRSWDGRRWSNQPAAVPSGAVSVGLSAVSCSSRFRCTAVGSFTTSSGAVTALAEGWDGRRWRIERLPAGPSGLSSRLSGVSCTSRTTCVAVGSAFDNVGHSESLAERWDGRRWSIQTVPMPPGGFRATLSAVSCAARFACTAVGDYSPAQSFVLDATLAVRLDRTGWSVQPTSDPPRAVISGLTGVSCPTRNDCSAVGAYDMGGGPVIAVAYGWDGTTWTIQATFDPAEKQTELDGVSCSAAAACTAVGHLDDPGPAGTSPIAERWDGTAWSRQAPVVPPSPGVVPTSRFGGVSCPSATACTAVGDDVNNGTEESMTLTERWDGTSWVIQP